MMIARSADRDQSEGTTRASAEWRPPILQLVMGAFDGSVERPSMKWLDNEGTATAVAERQECSGARGRSGMAGFERAQRTWTRVAITQCTN